MEHKMSISLKRTTQQKITDMLIRAQSYLVEVGWCTGKLAADKDGQSVRAKSHDAIQWCAIGAIQKVANRPETREGIRHKALQVLRSVLPKEAQCSLARFNDGIAYSKDDVVKLYDDAIIASKDYVEVVYPE